MAESNYWMLGRRAMTRRGMLRGALVGGTGLAASALIGCSSRGGKPASAPAAGGAAAQPGQPAAGAPKRGGRLANTFGAAPPSFDVHREITALVPGALSPAFNQLLNFDPLIAQQGPKSVVPDLAEKWEIAADGQTYTFHLVKNAKFHNGTAFTSADVKASFQRQLSPPAGVVMPRGSQIQAVKSIETPDTSTLTLKLSRPMSPLSLLPILAQSWMCIYSQKDITGNFDFQTKMNGTGPFRLKSADLTTLIAYDRNKDYHVKDRPYLDGVDYYTIPDASTLLAQIQAGAINIASVSPAAFATLKQVLGTKAEYQTIGLQTVSALNMNSKRGFFIDDRLRRAVALAYNKADAIKLLAQGEGDVGGYMLPGGAWALPKEELEKIDGYQPYSEAGLAEAKKLVAAAGIQSGATFTLLTATGQENPNLFLADQFKKLDIKATLNVVDYNKQYDALNNRNFDAFIISLAFFVDDPDSVYADHFLTNSPLNYSGVGSKAIDDLFLKQSTELDPQKRIELVKNMEKLALPQLSKLIFYYSRSRTVIQKAKDFVWPNHNATNHRFENVWLDA
ncbi:MAG: ABC transporter substrate-binding protein [Dehalococcoidia bacterium]|nr:ABC transporter substrate-binding protein [Dehalococcoidia bacterium]